MRKEFVSRHTICAAWLLLILVGIALTLLPQIAAAQGTPDHNPPNPIGAAPGSEQPKVPDAAVGLKPAGRALYPDRDSFGYGATVAPYNWVDISTTGTEITDWTGGKDDGYAGPFPTGFQFPFYDQLWEEFYVSTNGYVAFGAGSNSSSNSCLPRAEIPNNMIAVLWQDLDLTPSGNVYTQSFPTCPVGEGPCLVVAYHNIARYNGAPGSGGTLEAILYANGAIVLQFQDAGLAAGRNATIGIGNANAAEGFGLNYACYDTTALTDTLAIRFDLRGVALLPTRLETQDCTAAPGVHRFLALNHTGITTTFALAYAATPGVTVEGPPAVTVGAKLGTSIPVTVTPNICPALTAEITFTVAITGDGSGALSTVRERLAEGPIWQQLPVEPDSGGGDNVLAATNGRIWSITSYAWGGNPSVHYLDVAANRWTTVPKSAPPFGANHARSGCQHGDKVYVYGDGVTANFTGLWSYNMAANSWQQETPGGTPPPQSGLAAPAWAKDNETNRCYLTGGGLNPDAGAFNSAYVYDPVANAWLAPLPNFTAERNYHAAFVFRRPADNHALLCIVGGRHDVGPATTSQCFDLDAAPAAWNPENADIAPLSGPWWGMGYAMRTGANGPELWLVAGVRNFEGAGSAAEYYDLARGAWIAGGFLATTAVDNSAAVALDNQIYQVGGFEWGGLPTGNANVQWGCPKCTFVDIEPQEMTAMGCNNRVQSHRFSLWNRTAATRPLCPELCGNARCWHQRPPQHPVGRRSQRGHYRDARSKALPGCGSGHDSYGDNYGQRLHGCRGADHDRRPRSMELSYWHRAFRCGRRAERQTLRHGQRQSLRGL